MSLELSCQVSAVDQRLSEHVLVLSPPLSRSQTQLAPRLQLLKLNMADSNEAGEQSPITFHVKSSSDPKYTLTLVPSTTIKDLKETLAGSEYANVPAGRQRLIYSGRVLKDGDTLETHKVKDGHTIHLVKSAASNPTQPSTSSSQSQTSSTSAPTASGVPTNLAAGTGNSPLAGLTGARYAGFSQLPGAGMFGPDGGVSLNQPYYKRMKLG